MTRILVSITLFTGCFGGHDGPSVRDDVDEVSTLDGAGHATFVAGAPPATAGGPALQVATNPAVIPGGSAPVTLSGDAPFSTAIVAVDGLDGYFQIDLGAPVTTTELLVTLQQDLAAADFVFVYGIGNGGGFGYASVPVTVVDVGTGDVQVSLSWTTSADVDLHVIDPANEEIYWEHRQSASGGMLDLDSNAACGSDGPRNENITWPTGAAPAGTYQVRVDYWSNCGAAETPFVVTVNVHGQDPQTFSGSFTGAGDNGGANAGQPITTFTNGSARAGGHHVIGSFEVAPGPTRATKP
jgi:hypothetical protein